MRRSTNLGAITSVIVLGCVAPPKPAPAVFGGQGANVTAGKESPLPAEKG